MIFGANIGFGSEAAPGLDLDVSGEYFRFHLRVDGKISAEILFRVH